MVGVSQPNAGCTNCSGTWDVGMARRQGLALKELEAGSSFVELEPLRWNWFG